MKVGEAKSWVRSGYVVTVTIRGSERRFLVWGTNDKNAILRFSIASANFGYAKGSLKPGSMEAKFSPQSFRETNEIMEVA